jgi:serine/threonine protein phosphatase PrpC
MGKKLLQMDILKKVLRRTGDDAKLTAYGATDMGRQREENEDCYLLLPKEGIYIVADGMGGHNAGEVASSNVVKALAEYFTAECISGMRLNGGTVKEELSNAVIEAHKKVMEMSGTSEEYAGMGSTIAVSFIHDNVLHTCHVGDSRIYVINEMAITQITNDHSTVAELVRIGKMTREQARQSPLKNQITQALGVPFPVNPEYNRTYRLNEGDVVLICSDGLWDMIPDEDIHAIVMEGGSMEDTCMELIHRANEAGGDDNITVVLIQMGKNNGRSSNEARWNRKQKYKGLIP